MKKMAMLVGLVALAVVLVAPTALAAAHQCAGRPCTGTASANRLDERPGNVVPRHDLWARRPRRAALRLLHSRQGPPLRQPGPRQAERPRRRL